MVLWWIGNAILLLVVVPVLVALLNRVLAALERIRGASDDILAGGVTLIGEVDRVPDLLATTDQTIHDVSVGAVRYAGSVAKLLPAERKATPCPLVAWVTIVHRRLDHRRGRARPGAGDPAPHGRDRTTLAHLTGGVRVVAEQDQHGAHGPALGQRQPQARPRLLRIDLRAERRHAPPRGTSDSTTSWAIGYTITIVVVLVVVALVVPILLLARSIGNEAKEIDDSLAESVHNTAALAELQTTIESAEVITAGLRRGRDQARRLTMVWR